MLNTAKNVKTELTDENYESEERYILAAIGSVAK